AEETGINRGCFGQKKKAAGVSAFQDGLKRTMAANSYRDFRKFLRRHWQYRRIVAAACASACQNLRILNLNARNRLRHVSLGRWRLSLPLIVPRISGRGQECLLIHWAMEKLVDQHRVACASASTRLAVFRGEKGGRQRTDAIEYPLMPDGTVLGEPAR